ncbi:MAG: hypothetical protein A3F73_07960 [Gallionellales bacterium RIFCSPLOWO2_12_FULL_59_22]|nr:MAG: hypothetical protein A3H99_10640 [Gallionellales bacterium RIFCSPLOWO2_02_FULL_59_110]OGT04293.1 MAG: hypothetical protein A2Z65_06150 [Gallionellales bacterium RIFCSPLOWO2_02_58_13]OGT13263.1 MAG: hypothetical protein A3F73_07960 [Gallionellales bacterium RIFCSPLOWO2_12_FULL_59_22]
MEAEAEINYSSRGVITKIFGFIIMSLGVLDSLLSLRGGVPAYEFLLLIVFGAVVFAIGAVRNGQRAPVGQEVQADNSGAQCMK